MACRAAVPILAMPQVPTLSRASKAQLCLAALCIAVVDGVVRELVAPGRWFYVGDIVTIVPLGAIVYRWYHLDAQDHAYERPPALNVAVIVIGALALPYYFIRTRGYRRGALAALSLGFFCAGYLALQSAGKLAVDRAVTHAMARAPIHNGG